MTTLLVMTDGRRECIARAIPAALANLEGPIERLVIHDDSGDDEYRSWLRQKFAAWDVVWHPLGRQGFGGAIRNAWRHLAGGGPELVFHLEDDFVLRRTVDLTAMARVLAACPYLVQLALRRQPWNDAERAAGGVVEQHPTAYVDMVMGGTLDRWLEHREFFTTNPSLYRRSLLVEGWPEGERSEGGFTRQLLVDSDVRFGYWGARDSGEWVEHVGTQRAGCGY